MPTFVEMDRHVTLGQQMEIAAGPVVLVNRFSVDPAEAEQLLAAWAADAAVMKRQPGFISAQLHRGLGGSGEFLNCAVWESPAHFKQAFANPEFRAHLGAYPASTVVSPHLFQKVAVAGICTG